MPDVYLFSTFSKRANSTRQPALSSGVRMDCIFREGYDVLNPVIILDLRRGNGQYVNPVNYTYAYVPDLQRYYWVSDWAFAGGLWTCSLNVDVFASFKTDIGTTYIYAQRLADRLRVGAVTDGGLTDTMIPTLAVPSHSYSRLTGSVFQQTLDSGVYIIGVLNADDSAAGSVAYYAFTPAEFKIFRKRLMGGAWLNSTAEMGVDSQKAILNPIQYITSCQWFPLAPSLVSDASVQYFGMALGWWAISDANTTPQVTYKTIKQSGVIRFHLSDATLPVHPQYTGTTQRMLRCAPFSEYVLHMPYFGDIPLKYEDYASGHVGISIEIDLISGKGSVQIYDGVITSDSGFPDLRLVFQTSCQVATPIQLSQVVSDTWAAQVTEQQTAASILSQEAAYEKQVINGVAQSAQSIADFAMAPSVGGGIGAAGALASTAHDLTRGAEVLEANTSAASNAGLYSSFSQRAPRATSQGANGSILGAWCPVEIDASFLLLSTTAADVYARIGYAAGWGTLINEHSGFVQGLFSDFHSANCLKAEAMAIRQGIEAGIYYE